MDAEEVYDDYMDVEWVVDDNMDGDGVIDDNDIRRVDKVLEFYFKRNCGTLRQLSQEEICWYGWDQYQWKT